MCNRIKKYLIKLNERRLFRFPDEWLAAVIFDNDQVYATIKNNLALLERIPKPETGYHFRDIIRVYGPTGKQWFRDEEINEYKPLGLYKKSFYPTYEFEIILPDDDYFSLTGEFRGKYLKVEVPWIPAERCHEWRQCYFTAENIEIGKRILLNFVKKAPGREVRNIK